MGGGIAWADTVTDELTLTFTGVTGTTYTSWSEKSSESDAVYAGQSAGGNSSIQLRSSNNNSGVITTASGGNLKKITVTWNSNTANGRTLNVYGKSSAYSAATDLYSTSNQGTLLGTIVCGTSTSLTVSDVYEYVGFRSASGAMYLDKVEIEWETGGTTTLTCATPTFSPAAGTYTTAQNVAISTATDGATIYYTTDGTDPTTKSETFSQAISVSETTTIKAIAMKEGYDNSPVATAEYTFVSIEHAGTETDPYTVADARAAIDAGTGVTGVYATGIVSEIVTAYNSQYGNITYNISADGSTESDQLQSYRGKSYNGDDFTSEDDIKVGDVVVIYGNLKKYNSTYEFDAGNQLVSLQRPDAPVVPAIIAEDVSIAYDATSGEIEYTIINPVDGKTLTATSTAEWISNIVVGTDKVTFAATANEGDADRTATITLSYEGAADKAITVTQGHFEVDYATLPFEYDEGKSGIDTTTGLTQDGLGSDYNSSPKLKFDTTGDYAILKINEAPGKLTFDIKGNSFSGGTFTVQTSEDGVTYTDLKTYTELGDTQNEVFNNLAENVRFIKWIYTEKSSGNVALGNIKLEKPVVPSTDPVIAIDPAEVILDAGEHDGTLDITYENLTITETTDFDIQFYDANGNELTQGQEPEWLEVLVATQDPNIGEGYVVSYIIEANEGEARSAFFKVYALDAETNLVYSNLVTVTQAAYVAPDPEVAPAVAGVGAFVKVTSSDDITAGNYLIVYEDGSLAFDGNLETLDAEGNGINVSIVDGKIPATTATVAATFTIQPSGTIKSASGMYIGQTSDANGLASSAETEYTNTVSIDEDGNAVILSSGGAYLRYNSASNQNRFRYYKSSSYTGQKAIQLYKYDENATATIAITVSAAGYATYCSEYALDFSNVEGLTAYTATIANDQVTFTPATKVPAGEGVLLKGVLLKEAANTYKVPAIASAEAIENDFVGVLTATEVAAPIFVLLNGESGVGFYKTTQTFTVGAHTAYLPAKAGARSFIGFDNTTTAIEGVADVKGHNGEVYNLQGQRVAKAQKGLYIVNGKKMVIK